jgi:hypothetical protein
MTVARILGALAVLVSASSAADAAAISIYDGRDGYTYLYGGVPVTYDAGVQFEFSDFDYGFTFNGVAEPAGLGVIGNAVAPGPGGATVYFSGDWDSGTGFTGADTIFVLETRTALTAMAVLNLSFAPGSNGDDTVMTGTYVDFPEGMDEMPTVPAGAQTFVVTQTANFSAPELSGEISAVSEPGSIGIMGSGLAILAMLGLGSRFRRRA